MTMATVSTRPVLRCGGLSSPTRLQTSSDSPCGHACYSSMAGDGSDRSSTVAPSPPPSPQPPPRRSRPRFSYHVAAAFAAKDKAFDPSRHVFHLDPAFPSRQPATERGRRPESGQDAFFATYVNGNGGEDGSNDGTGDGSVAFGVADGVGGWVESGIDPADFSHALCGAMASFASSPSPPPSGRGFGRTSDVSSGSELSRSRSMRPSTARQLLQQAYTYVSRSRQLHAGGSTACLGIASAVTGTLSTANLGDSGFIILRTGAVLRASPAQTHGFNTPFQLSIVPSSMRARMAAFGGTALADAPEDADEMEISLRGGDVVVFATDGVWDNLFNMDVLRLVTSRMVEAGAWLVGGSVSGSSSGPGVAASQTNEGNWELRRPASASGGVSPAGGITVANDLGRLTMLVRGGDMQAIVSLQGDIALDIAAAAKSASVNLTVDGPFAKEVQRYYPQENWTGGKMDDICVVVAIVVEDGQDHGQDTQRQRVRSKL